MSLRQLVVLGTASQVPTKYRNHNGYLLLWDGQGVLFDPGEGTQRQMTMAGVTTQAIHHVAVTHFHGDHCLGLPGILQRISLDEVPHPVRVHYPASGQAYFDRLRHASIYVDKAHIVACPHDGPGLIHDGPTYALHTARLDHTAPAWGYRLVEPDSWTIDAEAAREAGVVGRAIGTLKEQGEVRVGDRTVRVDEVATPRPGQKVAFLMDTRPCPGALALARDADLLICESTFLDSEAAQAHEYAHMTASQAGRLAAEAGAHTLVLTHFSQRYPLNAPFVHEARAHHPRVIAATDLARIDLPPRRSA